MSNDGANDDMSGRDLLKTYYNYLQVERGLSQNSLSSYMSDLQKLNMFACHLGKTIQNLDRAHLTTWIQVQSREGASPNSIARRISAIKGLYNFLQRDGLIQENPSIELSTPRIQRKLPHFLNEEGIETLLGAPDVESPEGIRDRAILNVFYATGLRVSELVNLKMEDIDLAGALLVCHGKGSKQRIVPMGRASVASLNEYLHIRPKFEDGKRASRFFLRSGGHPLNRNYIWRLLKKYAQSVGLPRANPHSLRHSFATHLMNRGADSRSLQALLGHSDLSTTQIYTHISKVHLSLTLENFHPRSKK